MVEKDYLYKRPVDSDTETPRECHLQAVFSAYKNERISEEVYKAVMNSAVVRKEQLKEALDYVNSVAGSGRTEDITDKAMVKVSVAIVSSYGIESYEAANRRLRKLGVYLEGLIFTEEYGPTE